jgi:hypothetical protein
METKFWLDSTTVRGALVTVFPAVILILKAFHVEIGEGEQNTLVDGLVALAGLIGTAYAIIGRFKANSRITAYR